MKSNSIYSDDKIRTGSRGILLFTAIAFCLIIFAFIFTGVLSDHRWNELVVPISKSDWTVVYKSSPADCGVGMEESKKCIASPAITELWTSEMRRSDPSHHDRMRSHVRDWTYFGTVISPKSLRDAALANANHLLLGWLSGSVKVWLNGKLVFAGQHKDRRLPLSIPLEHGHFSGEKKLHVAIEMLNTSKVDYPDSIESHAKAGLATSAVAESYLFEQAFRYLARPLVGFTANLLFALLFLAAWSTNRENHALLYFAAFLLAQGAQYGRITSAIQFGFPIEKEVFSVSLEMLIASSLFLFVLAINKLEKHVPALAALSISLFSFLGLLHPGPFWEMNAIRHGIVVYLQVPTLVVGGLLNIRRAIKGRPDLVHEHKFEVATGMIMIAIALTYLAYAERLTGFWQSSTLLRSAHFPLVFMLGIFLYVQHRNQREAAARSRIFSEIATQVAHDIRSPLAALRTLVARENASLGSEQAMLMKSVVSRIEGIAAELGQHARNIGRSSNESKCTGRDVEFLCQRIVGEKKLEWHARKPGVILNYRYNLANSILVVSLDTEHLSRIISNLINNAFEAISDTGHIELEAFSDNKTLFIVVSDNGQGIDRNVLDKLAVKGATFGKSGGSGLGLYHARTMLEEWGGKLEITSERGKGTRVSIQLPRA